MPAALMLMLMLTTPTLVTTPLPSRARACRERIDGILQRKSERALACALSTINKLEVTELWFSTRAFARKQAAGGTEMQPAPNNDDYINQRWQQTAADGNSSSNSNRPTTTEHIQLCVCVCVNVYSILRTPLSLRCAFVHRIAADSIETCPPCAIDTFTLVVGRKKTLKQIVSRYSPGVQLRVSFRISQVARHTNTRARES